MKPNDVDALCSSRLRAVGLLCLPVVVALLTGSPSQSWASLSETGTAPLVGAVALAAWAGTTWLLLVVLVTVGGRLPGLTGVAATAVAQRVAPASVRALVRVAVGTTITLGVLGGTSALATPAGPTPSSPAPTTAASSYDWPGVAPQLATGPALDWPSTAPTGRAPLASTAPATGTAPATQVAPATSTPRGVLVAGATPNASPPHAAPSDAAPFDAAPFDPAPGDAVPGHVPATASSGRTVVVHQGDSLWALASQALGPHATAKQVAQAWPQWWNANRSLVGDHPELIHPGDVLHVPSRPSPDPH